MNNQDAPKTVDDVLVQYATELHAKWLNMVTPLPSMTREQAVESINELVSSEANQLLDRLEEKLIHSFDTDKWADGLNTQEGNLRETIMVERTKYPLKEEV